MRNHAGQPAFPGGAVDPEDADTIACALREAEEEVGLDPGTVEVVATLPTLWIPVSNFLVTPILAWWRNPHPVGPAMCRTCKRLRFKPKISPDKPCPLPSSIRFSSESMWSSITSSRGK